MRELMLIEFKNRELAQMCYDVDYVSKKYHPELLMKYRKVVTIMKAATDIREVYERPGLHCEKLSGDHKNSYSARINRQRRVLFSLQKGGGIEILYIEEISKHYE